VTHIILVAIVDGEEELFYYLANFWLGEAISVVKSHNEIAPLT
jgi:hypothetical protein